MTTPTKPTARERAERTDPCRCAEISALPDTMNHLTQEQIEKGKHYAGCGFHDRWPRIETEIETAAQAAREEAIREYTYCTSDGCSSGHAATRCEACLARAREECAEIAYSTAKACPSVAKLGLPWKDHASHSSGDDDCHESLSIGDAITNFIERGE